MLQNITPVPNSMELLRDRLFFGTAAASETLYSLLRGLVQAEKLQRLMYPPFGFQNLTLSGTSRNPPPDGSGLPTVKPPEEHQTRGLSQLREVPALRGRLSLVIRCA
jgi:hypothetical protein